MVSHGFEVVRRDVELAVLGDLEREPEGFPERKLQGSFPHFPLSTSKLKKAMFLVVSLLISSETDM